jgi:hypothetical protein
MNRSPTEAADRSPAMISEPEHTLIWSFRYWVCGHVHGHARHWDLAWRHLREVLGDEDGKRAVSALEGVVRAICRHAHRPVTYHEPHCPCLGADEQRLVSLIAACQRGDWLLASGEAQQLVDAEGVGELIDAAARLARLLSAHRQDMPLGRERKTSPLSMAATHRSSGTRLH